MPSTPFSAILARMSPERRARIAEGARALRDGDAKRKATYISEQAAAEYIESTAAHLRDTRIAGALPGSLCERMGGTVLYRVGALDEYMDTLGVEP